MKSKLIPVILAAAMALSLTACSHSSTSTTTVTTSFTDENGETTTHTTTTTSENGETVTEETVTEENAAGDEITEEPAEEFTEEDMDTPYEADESDIPTLRDEWADYFEYGAEGTTNEDERVLFTYDSPDPLTQAAIMIISPDDILTIYDVGPVQSDGDYYVIEDVDGDVELPFVVTDTADDHFEMTFKDGSYAELYYVDKDTIIDDMVSIIEQISE
ncbi:MAG: hypothetical protein K6G83_00420 [Lachnospiraceae bacterium]|nr:hypothetical protein [Lachnospiraceae bacterium]